ncbi:MAG: alpha-amylase family glycosyl hydrolase [bacterium]
MVLNVSLKGKVPFEVQHKAKDDSSALKNLNSQSQTVPNYSTPLHAHKAYSQVGFGGSLLSHKSWGAAVQASGDVNFKLFTWPDAKKVFVEISDSIKPEQKFRDGFIKLVNDTAGKVIDIVAEGNKSRIVELSNLGGGVFEKKFDPNVAKNGEKYRFVIIKGNDEIITVNDPYAMKQENIHGWSTIYDHNKFEWGDQDWMAGKVPEKISRIHYKSKTPLSNLNNAIISELNIATLTEKGDFESAKKILDIIAEDKIFNSIEIMPVENTHSFNWGYDGVNKFAVSNYLGGPDQLKEFINHAHKNKLNVIMDIVPNHVGPDGNYLGITGPYLDGDGPYGSYLNFEKEHNRYVREYIVNSALLWARDYHCDGLRCDMTGLMKSDNTMKDIALEVNHHHPHVPIIAEDGRNNDPRVTRPLKPEEISEDSIEKHCEYIEKINSNNVPLDNLGYDSQWDFDFQKRLLACILGSWDGHTKDLYALDNAIKSSPQGVHYLESHDDIGNLDGIRLIPRDAKNNLGVFSKVIGNSNSEKGQKAAQGTQALLEALVTGNADKMTPLEWGRFNQRHNIQETIPLNNLKESFKKDTNKHKLALGQIFASPGPKMVFQGDESGVINPFQFYREFSTPLSAEEQLEETLKKGYQPGIVALLKSKMTSINYSDETKKNHGQIKAFSKKFVAVINETPALKEGQIKDTVIHQDSDVWGIHRQEGLSETFSITNFSDFDYDKNYYINFPKGKWQEILNSDAEEFGGSAKFANSAIVDSDNLSNKISLPGNSILVFKKI